LGLERGTKCIEAGLNPLLPVIIVVDRIGCGIIMTDGDTMLAWSTCIELEGVEGVSMEIVGDSVNVLEFIVHV
jgi:hypothetical protein